MAISGERFVVALAILGLCGVLYDLLVTWINRQTADHGYTAFLVVGGTLVTLAGLAWVAGLQAALVTLILFTAAGLSMVVGSVRRSLRQRAQTMKALDDQVREAIHAH